MRNTLIAGLATVLLGLGASAVSAQETGSQACLECHDYGEDSPVHLVLAGAHGTALETDDDRQGCIECHGNSASHMRTPQKLAGGQLRPPLELQRRRSGPTLPGLSRAGHRQQLASRTAHAQ